VVLVREDNGWEAFFCTDPAATVGQILEAFADRAAIEQDFHDLKEVHGARQQQLRHYWANIAAYHLNLWLHTLIELWAWERPHGRVCDVLPEEMDRPDSPHRFKAAGEILRLAQLPGGSGGIGATDPEEIESALVNSVLSLAPTPRPPPW
jgi:hypothetical protein